MKVLLKEVVYVSYVGYTGTWFGFNGWKYKMLVYVQMDMFPASRGKCFWKEDNWLLINDFLIVDLKIDI
jgi:hypothetical protein